LRRHRPVGPPIEPSGQRLDGIRIAGPHSAVSHSGSPGDPVLDDDVGRPHAARQLSITSAAVDAIRASRMAWDMLQRSAAARRRHGAVRLTGRRARRSNRTDQDVGAIRSHAARLLRIRVDKMTQRPRRATLRPRYPDAARSGAGPRQATTMTAALLQPCGCTA
jgi:hypothetical protein